MIHGSKMEAGTEDRLNAYTHTSVKSTGIWGWPTGRPTKYDIHLMQHFHYAIL